LSLPPLSQPAAWGLIALFIAVYPANINMAVNHIEIDSIPSRLESAGLPFSCASLGVVTSYGKIFRVLY